MKKLIEIEKLNSNDFEHGTKDREYKSSLKERRKYGVSSWDGYRLTPFLAPVIFNGLVQFENNLSKENFIKWYDNLKIMKRAFQLATYVDNDYDEIELVEIQKGFQLFAEKFLEMDLVLIQ